MLLTIANQKGGVGKTTVTTLLAIELKNKYKIAVVDTDPQSSLFNNVSIIPNHNIAIFKQNISDFVNNISLYKEYDIILVDTLPTTDINIVNLFIISNFVIIPSGANQLDITACLNTIKVLKSINKQYKIIFNNIKNLNDFQEIKNYLEKENIQVAHNYLLSRVAYSRLFKNHLIINDFKAQTELHNLINELL